VLVLDRGNVGIGTASPAAIISGSETTLNVKGGSANNVGSIVARSFGTTNSTTIGIAALDSSNLTALYVESNSPLAIYTNATERMRITSVGFTKARANGGSYFGGAYHEIINNNNVSGNICLVVGNSAGSNTNNTASIHFLVADNAGDRMYVYGNGNVVNINGSYGTLSDISLKENIKDATSKLADILKLKVRNFNLIGSEEKQIGFIAQELEQIFPSMVDINGRNKMKTIKTSVLVPMLVKAIQELKQEIDTLKTN
jgi:hypothetical protein